MSQMLLHRQNRKAAGECQRPFLLHIQQNSRTFLYLRFDYQQAIGGQIIPWVLLEAECQQMPQLFPQLRRQNAFGRAEKIIVHAGSQRFNVFRQCRVA